MSEPVQGVIVSHRSLARALIEAVDCIVGAEHGLTAVSNDDCGSALLEERIEAVLGTEPTILFTDMPGGSCFMASAKKQRQRDRVRVISGVNLPMLLEFVQCRKAGLEPTVERLLETGTKSIRSFPS